MLCGQPSVVGSCQGLGPWSPEEQQPASLLEWWLSPVLSLSPGFLFLLLHSARSRSLTLNLNVCPLTMAQRSLFTTF